MGADFCFSTDDDLDEEKENEEDDEDEAMVADCRGKATGLSDSVEDSEALSLLVSRETISLLLLMALLFRASLSSLISFDWSIIA